MPTPATLLAEVAAAVESLSGATRLASDYRDDLEAIPSGATRYQLRGASAGTSALDSNASKALVALAVSIHHRLAGAERDYTEGAMQTVLASLTNSSWWRALAAVSRIEEQVEEAVVERVGSVVSASVQIVVELVPGP